MGQPGAARGARRRPHPGHRPRGQRAPVAPENLNPDQLATEPAAHIDPSPAVEMWIPSIDLASAVYNAAVGWQYRGVVEEYPAGAEVTENDDVAYPPPYPGFEPGATQET